MPEHAVGGAACGKGRCRPGQAVAQRDGQEMLARAGTVKSSPACHTDCATQPRALACRILLLVVLRRSTGVEISTCTSCMPLPNGATELQNGRSLAGPKVDVEKQASHEREGGVSESSRRKNRIDQSVRDHYHLRKKIENWIPSLLPVVEDQSFDLSPPPNGADKIVVASNTRWLPSTGWPFSTLFLSCYCLCGVSILVAGST